MNASERANREITVATLGLIRDLQVRVNDLTIMVFALETALAERDEGFVDVYLAQKERMEGGETAQQLAGPVDSLNQLIDTMNADLR